MTNELNEVSSIIKKLSNIPEEVSEKEYLIIPSELVESILNENRTKIIKLLYNQNPLTEEKLTNLFRYNTHEDLIVLEHLGLVIRETVDNEKKHDIITLNRKIKVI